MIQEHFLSTADHGAWHKHLPANRSVFGSLGYARICEAHRSYSARLYVLVSDETAICYPLFLRSLSDLPFPTTALGKWDSVTPDFTGPLVYGADRRLGSAFCHLRNALLKSEGVVAEFAHLHPWLSDRGLLADGCVYNRDVVWVDVSLPLDVLWREHFRHSCRKGIQRAEREGVRVFAGSTDDHVREFHRIYLGTMDRRNALASYYFSYEFFKAFLEELPANSRFMLAEYHDRIVAATLYLYDDHDVYSFLGGTDVAFQHVRPTNAVICETIRWAHGAGKKRLILGGGNAPNDSLFRFKSTFSRFHQPFYVYKRIHREQDYAVLERRCREHNGLNGDAISYFPAYRHFPLQSKPEILGEAL